MNIKISSTGMTVKVKQPMPSSPALFVGCLALLLTGYSCQRSQAQVIISEIADKGTADHCLRNDWLEIHNSGTEGVDISGWILQLDNNGAEEDPQDEYIFPPDAEPLGAGAFLVLCMMMANDDSPQFSIGGSDTITLIDTSAGNNSSGVGNEQVVASQVQPPGGTDSAFDFTYALDETDGSYKYTVTPTPGMANIIVRVPPIQERLSAQNAEGTAFFNMDDRGLPVPGGMDEVVDLHITMEEADFQDLMQNASYQLYSPFTSARVVMQEEVLVNLTNPGRIRTKGQSTLNIGVCFNSSTIPFLLDFSDDLPSQTLFGVEQVSLRNHMGDYSYMREWAANRMLARFGLPHLRGRMVRFFINQKKIGLYTLLESMEQDYVFYRGFPNVNFADYSLYKVKTASSGCGTYGNARLAAAEARMGDNNTPPYSFERGEHREKIPVLGPGQEPECLNYYHEVMINKRDDVVLAYLRADRDCGAMLVEQRQIDRKLGGKHSEPVMGQFINENLADNECNAGCQNSNMAADVDVDNFLKTFAVYSALLIQDSPIGNQNNYFLADRGDGMGWNILAWDENTAGDATCNPDICNPRLVHWSILRPTCQSLESNQLVGPLLTNSTLQAKYIDYVRSFVNDVMGNASLVEQMQQHGKAIQDDVALDYWSEGGIYFPDNLLTDPTLWNKDDNSFPLLPLYSARAIDIRNQLEALDKGTFPRGPHLDTPVDPAEFCVDWRSTEPEESRCPQDCLYEGCDQPGWSVPSLCDSQDNQCYHGDYDDKCKGISDSEQYNGMEMRNDRETFCYYVQVSHAPIKMSLCPADVDTSNNDTSDGASPDFRLVVVWASFLSSFLLV